MLAMAGLELYSDTGILRNTESPEEVEFKDKMSECRKGIILRQALRECDSEKEPETDTDMPPDSEEEEAWCPGGNFEIMLERCLEVCRRTILIKQMHRTSIAVGQTEMTKAGYEQAIEMYKMIDIAAHEMRWETVEGFKQIHLEAAAKAQKLRWKREAAAREEEQDAKQRRSQKKACGKSEGVASSS